MRESLPRLMMAAKLVCIELLAAIVSVQNLAVLRQSCADVQQWFESDDACLTRMG